MAKVLNRQQKAANTRKARKEIRAIGAKIAREWIHSKDEIKPVLKINFPKDYTVTDGPAMVSLSKALDNSLDRLEQRMAGYIARVDGILA